LRSALAESTVARVLYELVSIPSPTGSEGRCSEKLAELARELGLDAWVDESQSFYAALPGFGRRALILFASHVDTIDEWLEPRLEGNVVRGRGAVDAKGPLLSMLLALYELSSEGFACPAAVAGLSGEEGDSRGARKLVEASSVPPYVVIGEPTGLVNVVVGYRGGAKLAVSCYGRGGHPSSPWAGDSALDKLLAALEALRKAFPGSGVGSVTISVTKLLAGESCKALPRRAECCLDVRVPVGASAKSVVEAIAAELERAGCEARVLSLEEPFKTKPQSEVPRSLVRALLELGIKPSVAIKAGTSDMNVLGPCAKSIAAYGPGDPSLAHSDAEALSASEVLAAARVYARAAKYLCSRAEGAEAVRLPGR